jgi:hypothetical protein
MIGFVGAVTAAQDLWTVKASSVTWHASPYRHDPSWAGYLSLEAVDSGSGRLVSFRVPVSCGEASALASTLAPGALLTVLVNAPSYLDLEVGVKAPIASVIWLADDWYQPVYGYVFGDMESFGRFAGSEAVAPFDLARTWTKADNREHLVQQYSTWEIAQGWVNSDPFIRSLDVGDLPGDVAAKSTVIEGQVSYDDAILKELAADPLSRVVVRTEDGVLAAAAVQNVGKFQWRSQLLDTSATITVWISHTGDLTGGIQVAELKLTDQQHVNGTQVMVTITSASSATAEIVR